MNKTISIAVLLAIAGTANAQPRGRLLANPPVLIIQDEGVSLAQQNRLNMIGAGVVCVSNATTLTIDCTFSGSGGGGGVADPGTNGITKRTSLNVLAPAVAGTDFVIPAGNVATATALGATPTLCGAGNYPLGVLANGNATGCTAATGGSGNMLISSGAGDPSGACTAGITQYLQTTTQDEWFCAVSGTWKKKLSTLNTGTHVDTGLTGTAPGTPAAGNLSEYFDSSAKVPQSVDDAGAKGTMVRPIAAVTSQWVRSLSTLGVFTLSQPAESDLSFTDITTGNVSTTKHGYVPKAPNVATQYLDGSGGWSVPAGGVGGSTLGVAWGYDGGTSVTTSATKLCTVDVPASTLGTGGTSGHALSMKFAFYNNTGSGNLTYTINYGASSYTLVAGSGTGNTSTFYGEVLLANDLGVTNAQTMTLMTHSKVTSGTGAAPEFTQLLNEPNQNSASGTLDFSLKATAATTTQTVRVFMCSIKLL